MTNSVWPLSLPQAPLANGYKENMPSNLIRSDAEYGPAKVRRRGGVKPVVVKATYILTTEQAEILDDFVFNNLAGGAVCFDWPRPRFSTTQGGGKYVRSRLVPSSDGIYVKASVGNTTDYWQVELTLELFTDVPTLSFSEDEASQEG